MTGFQQIIPAVSGMTTPLLAGLVQQVNVYGPGVMAAVSASVGAALAGYMAQSKKIKAKVT